MLKLQKGVWEEGGSGRGGRRRVDNRDTRMAFGK